MLSTSSTRLLPSARYRPRAMVFQWLSRQHYRYNLWTGLYMLDPWERALYSTFSPPSQVLAWATYLRAARSLANTNHLRGTASSIVLVRLPRILSRDHCACQCGGRAGMLTLPRCRASMLRAHSLTPHTTPPLLLPCHNTGAPITFLLSPAHPPLDRLCHIPLFPAVRLHFERVRIATSFSAITQQQFSITRWWR